ncbi:hypothetical protein Gocc_0962 [Gaiella occulta]|uniref:Uncharacterized protein n=2 Tax=Gaiella occulta TaxID=1002870 RepID=A0A7M2YZH8_9ACTN|nr:hypothetical protein Gocc_0962 [Gaiella occulta]
MPALGRQVIPRSGDRPQGDAAETLSMAAHTAPIAALVALVSGWAVIRHCRAMLHSGVSLEDGGGWTAVILAETVVCLTAVAVALS